MKGLHKHNDAVPLSSIEGVAHFEYKSDCYVFKDIYSGRIM